MASAPAALVVSSFIDGGITARALAPKASKPLAPPDRMLPAGGAVVGGTAGTVRGRASPPRGPIDAGGRVAGSPGAVHHRTPGPSPHHRTRGEASEGGAGASSQSRANVAPMSPWRGSIVGWPGVGDLLGSLLATHPERHPDRCFYHAKIDAGQILPSDGSLSPPGWRPADRPEFQEVTEEGWLRLGWAIRSCSCSQSTPGSPAGSCQAGTISRSCVDRIRSENVAGPVRPRGTQR